MSKRITRALISVSNKDGVVEFARFLSSQDVEIISTGGTASRLRGEGIEVVEASRHTGFPECLEGRVKTLHPIILGGILFRRENPEDTQQAESLGMLPIDLVVVNLYPFEATVAKPNCSYEEAIENIDVGGPSMIRSAAKNHNSVTVVTNPTQYSDVVNEMVALDGRTSIRLRKVLALEAFNLTSRYDAAIASYLKVPFE